MGQPVNLSSPLVLDARMAGEPARRSIAGQIEFWAQLGRSIEPLLDGMQVLALQKSGKVLSMAACLRSADSPAGRPMFPATNTPAWLGPVLE
ncbi:MAG: hypothetical protein HYY17_10290 [Planctomycetes bacterium]|nr:hypothetical protein [Planctomycetota bacterium]